MAIETRDDEFDFRKDFSIQRETPALEYSTLDIVTSGLRRQNPISNIDFSGSEHYEPELGYDPFADKAAIAGFEPWAENFAGSQSRGETESIKRKIQMENYDRQVLQDSGWGGILAEMAGGASNPVLWLSAISTGGTSLAATIGAVAAAEATSEGILQAQQETRTWEESAVNVAAAAGVTGVLGGVAHLLAKRTAAKPVAPPSSKGPKGELVPPSENPLLKGTSIVDKTGKPMVVYHGTFKSFKEISVNKGSEFTDPGMDVFNLLGAHFSPNAKTISDDFLPLSGDSLGSTRYWDEIQGNLGGKVDTLYAPGANIRPVYLNIKKPFNLGSEDTIFHISDPAAAKMADWAEKGSDLARFPELAEKMRAIFIDTKLAPKEAAKSIRKLLKSHGYDGLEYTGELADIKGAKAYVAFENKQIISTMDSRLFAADAEMAAMTKQLADDIKSPGGAAAREVVPTNMNVPQPDDFVPSAHWTPDQMGSKANVPDLVAKHLSYGNPLMRLMSSPSGATRSVTESLLETPMYLRKNVQGAPTEQALETLIKVDTAPTGAAMQATRDAFNKSMGFGPGEINFIRARIKAGWRGEHGFKEKVGAALRRGGASDDPLVAQAAAIWRAKVFDPLKERAMKLELFPEQKALRAELTALEKRATKEGLSDELTAAIAAKTDELAKWVPEVKGADSYLTRVYDYQKLAQTADDFKAAVAKYLQSIEGYSEAEAKKIAKSIHAKLLTKDNMFGMPKPEFRGSSRVSSEAGGALRERTVTLPENILEPWLISDIEHVGRTYTRRMAAEINLAEKFGDRTLKKQIDAIKADYDDLIEAATSKKDKLILHNALRDNIRDLEAMRDMFIGTYGLPSDPSGIFARGNRMARSWQYTVALGMQTISALPDMARPIITNGLMSYGIGLSKALPFMAKIAKEDVKRMGIGLDMLTSGRMRAIATLDEIPLVGGKFEHGMEEIASGFGKVSGMDQWNSFWKQYSGIMAVDRIAGMAEKGWTKLSKAEQTQLNWLGIDADSLNGIRGQFAKYGTKDNGFNVANIASWDHGPARNLMAAANKEADALIITPGKGDKPLLASTDLGKTLFQFQSFVAASTNRMLLSGLAQKDINVVQSIFMGVVIGSIAKYAKDVINGRDTKWANDPALIIANGLDQAGTLGLVAQIPVSVAAAAYEGKPVSKALLQSIPGVDVPAEGLLRAAGNIAGGVQKGDPEAAAKAAAKLLPYQNLFYLRILLNEMGDGERSAMGLKRPENSRDTAQSGSPFGG